MRCAPGRRRPAASPARSRWPQRSSCPQLTSWKYHRESPEAKRGFDDSSWAVADKMTTNSVTGVVSLPVLYADDYGFHTGNTWYRGRFRSTGKETGVHLVSDSGGGAQAFSAWLNGRFLGSSTTGSADFAFPAGSAANARRQRPLRAHGQHGPRGGLQLDQRQQDGPRAHHRLADRRAAQHDHLAPAGRARRRGRDRPRARAAVHRRPLRRARRLVAAGVPRRRLEVRDPADEREAGRACRGIAPR